MSMKELYKLSIAMPVSTILLIFSAEEMGTQKFCNMREFLGEKPEWDVQYRVREGSSGPGERATQRKWDIQTL